MRRKATCGVLALFALISARRYTFAVTASRERLQQYNAELESRVAERTSELAQAAQLADHERSRAESLLTDVNHRVGNNLALVSSFLTMQLRSVKNPDAARALDAARSRVQAIASAHRKLRLGADFASVKADEVLGAVIDDIAAGLSHGDLIRISYQVEPLEINARDAVSLGVLTSELVMNAVKHAFVAGQSGEVYVVFSGETQVPFLEVADNGVGWNEKEINETSGLGSRIIEMVARQFGSKPERSPHSDDDRRPGTRIRIDLAKLQLARSV
jgi:two-component sensor histidine kinase